MFFKTSSILLLAAAASLAVPLQKRAFTPPTKSFIQELQQSTQPIDRYALLTPDQWGFNFLEVPSMLGGGLDGGVVFGFDQIWAGLVGNEISMLIGFLGPCGMIPPHSHPRAAEVYLNVAGPLLMSAIIPESGGPVVNNLSPAGSAVVLPQGSVHFIANTGCEPMTFVAGFNHENPGVLFQTDAFGAFDNQTYAAAFGGAVIPWVDPSQIPTPVIIGRQQCLSTCGIDASTYNISTTSNSELYKASMAGYLKAENYTASAWNMSAPASPPVMAVPSPSMAPAPTTTPDNSTAPATTTST